MAKKYTGNYTTDAGKALKGAGRLFCRIDDDGAIYLCNGFVVYRMNAYEYAATVQPVTKCEPGNWIIENGEKREAGPADFDVVKTFRDTVNACTGAALDRCPAEFTIDKGGRLSSYYSSAGFAAFYNQLYTSGLYQGLTIRANSAISPAVFYDGEEAVAMVLPVKAKPEAARAVMAYFTGQPADDNAAELENLRNSYDAEQRKTAEQATELEALRAELDALRSAKQAATVEQPAEDAKSAAELIVARFAGLDGVRAVIKGAQTAAPVVWLSGDTEKHTDAIRAAGARWSGKKGAYYVRVA